MKRLMITLGFVAAMAVSSQAMNTDDILALCQSGFEPDKIARIVDATGLDQPLTTGDWVRLKTEGCGDDVVEALLDVLVPVDEEGQEVYDSDTEYRDRDVNVYVSGDWGWNGWYGSLFWGYDPYWSFGWNTWDPWAGWCWTSRASWWYDPWGPSYYHHRYWGWDDRFYYGHGHRPGWHGYDGRYVRHKALRRAGHSAAEYAVVKSSPIARRAVHANVQTRAYRATSTVATGNATSGHMTARTKSGRAGTAFTTRSQSRGSSNTSTGARSSGTYAKRKTSGAAGSGQTVTPRTGAQPRTTVRSQPGSSGTTSTAKPKAKKSSRSGGTPPSGSSYSPPPTSSTGRASSGSQPSQSSHNGTLKPRPKR
ncbi:MAG: hypothetical protein AB1792_05770 [Candidatus Zixiibacteriota bacterium]